ncbi:phage terminase small subunit [Corynebacterium glyciniphilum]|uniref:phage terminase small subunit n=1 Tax=Corynebacterium glyciniphilum TaxID=1404244 RepID=UPI003FCFCE5B
MPGKGFAPKPGDQLAGHGAKKARNSEMTVVEIRPNGQPPLVDIIGAVNPITDEPFSRATLRLWEELAQFATLGLLMDAQWSLLARAMVLDDAVMHGDAKWASEARLQMQKFGIAPDDVLRMRVQVVQADEAEAKRETERAAAPPRWGDLKAVD